MDEGGVSALIAAAQALWPMTSTTMTSGNGSKRPRTVIAVARNWQGTKTKTMTRHDTMSIPLPRTTAL